MDDQFETFDPFLNDDASAEKLYRNLPLKKIRRSVPRTDVPDKIRAMKELAFTPEAYWKTSPWLFRQQGLFMKDYSDDQPFGEDFAAYYPTYRDLSTEQLRGYFSWRTVVRHGEFPDAPQPFIIMYAYELINLIGIEKPEEAFRLLRLHIGNYGERCPELQKNSAKWLTDLAAYHQLPPEMLSGTPDYDFDSNVLTLCNWETQDEDNLFAAVSRLSAYQPERSAAYEKEPEIFRRALCRSYENVAIYFLKNRKCTLHEKLFGKPVEIKHRLFEGAVFFDTEPRRSFLYEVSGIHKLECRNGEWFCKKLYGNRGRNKPLGEIVRTVDSTLRECLGDMHKLAPGSISSVYIKLISKTVSSVAAEMRRPPERHIDIDLSALDSIRSAADITRERLIVEVEEDAPLTAAEVPDVPVNDADTPLDEGEREFLKALLGGGDWSGTARKFGISPSMLADSVNEKLFDVFSDTVIDFDGDTPYIIEDYAGDIPQYI